MAVLANRVMLPQRVPIMAVMAVMAVMAALADWASTGACPYNGPNLLLLLRVRAQLVQPVLPRVPAAALTSAAATHTALPL